MPYINPNLQRIAILVAIAIEMNIWNLIILYNIHIEWYPHNVKVYICIVFEMKYTFTYLISCFWLTFLVRYIILSPKKPHYDAFFVILATAKTVGVHFLIFWYFFLHGYISS